ncbi:MAG TPA: LCP family protein [Actinomycetota bacterium]|nr:LCP family protein [Actinomycetota bacterium]
MSGGRRLLVAAAVGAIALLVGAAGGLLAPTAGPASPSPGASPSTSPETSPNPPTLGVELTRVRGLGVRGPAPAGRVRAAAREVRDLMAELYTEAFVDPAAWQGGRFPGLERFFAGPVRGRVRHDLSRLSLGPGAGVLDEVLPTRARVEVTFLLDGAGRPLSAVARMGFEGRGLAPGLDVRIAHHGRYRLARTERGWRIVAYDVDGRIPSPGEMRRLRARSWPGLEGRDPLFVLVIGSDARPGQAVAGTRADSIHLVAVEPRSGRASILGIPRDSWVTIPGHGAGRINGALVAGGPELLVRTVELLTGIPVDAYVLTGFQGFERMVDAVGGIEVAVPYAMSDPYSRAYFRPGRQRLSGREALRFSRNRHDAPGGDFGRSLNQGRLMVAALAELRRDAREDPVALFRWVLAGVRNLRTDLSMREILELVAAAPSIDPSRVRNRVVSGTGATVDGASVIRLGERARSAFRDLRDGILDGR